MPKGSRVSVTRASRALVDGDGEHAAQVARVVGAVAQP